MNFLYVSHPEVVIDPSVPVPEWGLSDLGRSRAMALASAWPGGWRIVTSPEAKARQTAAILAKGAVVPLAPGSGEIDRRSTGYVPFDRHEALVDRLFAHPDQSADGWETARAAQARIVAAARKVVAGGGPVVMVGHGGVGALLWCAVTGQAIARQHDQPGLGCVWAAQIDRDWLTPLWPWRRFEQVSLA